MSMTSAHGDHRISLDEVRLLITQISDNMTTYVASLDGQTGSTHLPNLKAAVDRIGMAFPRRPPVDARYGVQWKSFVSGKRKDLDPDTTRYLCWEPEVATSDRFLAYLWSAGLKLTTRPLAGLVRSCHATWKPGPGTYPSTGVIKDLVKQYEGLSPVILKWKSDLNALFGMRGPETFGLSFIRAGKKLHAFLDEWYLDPQSPFVREVVERATAICNDQFDKPSPTMMKILFGELLPWSGWNLPALKQEIGTLILSAASDQAREILQKFVLVHRGLGDPRIPGNEAKWAAISPEARSRFEGWLTENPFGLKERVYRQGQGWTWQKVGEPYTVRFNDGRR